VYVAHTVADRPLANSNEGQNRPLSEPTGNQHRATHANEFRSSLFTNKKGDQFVTTKHEILPFSEDGQRGGWYKYI